MTGTPQVDGESLKLEVRDFWNKASCGEGYARGESERERYEVHNRTRYELEPYIHGFGRFADGRGKDVLEIGVGMGADHLEWAKAKPRTLTGIDLTPRAIEHTGKQLELFGFTSKLLTADAEDLPFEPDSFDLVYSWGVLHHSPNTARTIDEIHRVLRPGGITRVMLYHKHSMTGYMLWLRYALMAAKPRRTLDDIFWHHLESPGTKAFSVQQARQLFSRFGSVSVRSQLSFGDLLQGDVGQRHKGALLMVAKRLWPRAIVKRVFRHRGLMLLIEARKNGTAGEKQPLSDSG